MTGTLKPETKKQEPIYKSLVRLEIMLSHDPNELGFFLFVCFVCLFVCLFVCFFFFFGGGGGGKGENDSWVAT